MIKDLSQAGTVTFQTQCQAAFDKRWNQFNFDLYLLAYFLHPRYRGIVIIIILFISFYLFSNNIILFLFLI